jgi:hypothetical protein
MDVFQQGFVYQGLVVAAAGLVYHPAKVVEDSVVQADRSGRMTGPRRAPEKSMSRYLSAAAFFIEHLLERFARQSRG